MQCPLCLVVTMGGICWSRVTWCCHPWSHPWSSWFSPTSCYPRLLCARVEHDGHAPAFPACQLPCACGDVRTTAPTTILGNVASWHRHAATTCDGHANRTDAAAAISHNADDAATPYRPNPNVGCENCFYTWHMFAKRRWATGGASTRSCAWHAGYGWPESVTWCSRIYAIRHEQGRTAVRKTIWTEEQEKKANGLLPQTRGSSDECAAVRCSGEWRHGRCRCITWRRC